VRELERAVEPDPRPGDGCDRTTIVVLPVVVDGGRLGRGDHDLVADSPSGGGVDVDRRVALVRRTGQTGPRGLGRAVGVEHAGGDDPQPDIRLERLGRVTADEAAFVDVDELDLVNDLGRGRTHGQAAGDDHVAT
jgi:hypothetical protein